MFGWEKILWRHDRKRQNVFVCMYVNNKKKKKKKVKFYSRRTERSLSDDEELTNSLLGGNPIKKPLGQLRF